MHEARHRQIGLDTAARVQAAAVATRSLPDCDVLRVTITSAIDEQIRQGSARNREFDADTHHGLDAGTGLDR